MHSTLTLEACHTSAIIVRQTRRPGGQLGRMGFSIPRNLSRFLLLQLKSYTLSLQFCKYVIRSCWEEGEDSEGAVLLILLEPPAETERKSVSIGPLNRA